LPEIFLLEIYYFMEIFHHKLTAITKDQQQFRTHKETPRTYPDLNKKKAVRSQEKKKNSKETSRSLPIISIFTKLAGNVLTENLLFHRNILSRINDNPGP
jgi:hypothetical protein